MSERSLKYRTLFFSALQLSAFTFGGGFVIVPLMRKKFVEQLHWIDEKEMLDMTAIAQSSPGPIAVNASILVGYRVAGAAGAMVMALGTVLPPLVIISVISLFYAAFRDNAVVSMVMKGMLAGVAAVVFDVVYALGRDVFRARRALPILVMLAAFVANHFLNVNILLIILACGGIGALDALRRRRGGEAQK